MGLTKERANKYVDDWSGRATKTLKNISRHPMLLVIVSANGNHIVDLDPLLKPCEELYDIGAHSLSMLMKDMLGMTIKKVLKAAEAVGFGLVTEVWVSKVEKNSAVVAYGDEPGKATVLNSLPLPREMPNRIEGLSIAYEFKLENGEKMSGMRTWAFHRDENGKVTSIDSPEDNDNSGAVGRFVGLLE